MCFDLTHAPVATAARAAATGLAEIKPSEALYRFNEGQGRTVPGGGILTFGRGKPSANCVHARCHSIPP